jgi:uncharacterized membrane protein YfcA
MLVLTGANVRLHGCYGAPVEPALVLLVTFAALTVSSVAGYGGSLILVPALAAILGPREGIALAGLVLACNNVCKCIAYRRTLALRRGRSLLVVTVIGVVAGSQVLLVLPERALVGLIVVAAVGSLAAELAGDRLAGSKRRSVLPMTAASSTLSGATGTSGPLKGMAIRHLGLPRLEHVGLASAASLLGDAVKTGIFADAGLLPSMSPFVLLAAAPMMPVAAWLGLRINTRISEDTFRWVFWGVVGAYTMRMAGLWF